MKTLLACLAGTAMLLPSVSFAFDNDTPPSVAAPASQSSTPRGPSKLSARFTTQWSTGNSTTQLPVSPSPRVAPRAGIPAGEGQ